MKVDIDINEEGRAAISSGLSKLLADCYALYLKTQNYHWNVTGPEFYSLHILFEKQYEDLAEAIDIIAERIRALGFYVDGSMHAFQKLSSMQESGTILPKHEMLEDLVGSHELVIREGRKLADLAEKYRDQGTVDLLGKRLGEHEKMAWMLRSQI